MNNTNLLSDATTQWERNHVGWITRFERQHYIHPTEVFRKIQYFLNLSSEDFNEIIHTYRIKNKIDFIDIDEERIIATFQPLVTNFINRLLGLPVNFEAPYSKEMSLVLMTKIIEFSHMTYENLQSKPELHHHWQYNPLGYFHINYIEKDINNYIFVYPYEKSTVRCYCPQTGESISEHFSNINLFSYLKTLNGDS